MHISDLELFLLETPRIGPQGPVRSLLVRLVTDRDSEGWGETGCSWAAEELPGRRDALLPALADRNVFGVEEILQLDALADAALRSAVEMACWDAIGRIVDQPLCHLMGGMFRNHIPLALRLPDEPAERLGQHARELADHGFHTLLLEARGDVAGDLQLLAAVAGASPERAELMLDGGGRYDVESVRELADGLPAGVVRFLLDPLAGDDLRELAALARQVNVPLAVSRPLHSAADVLAAARTTAASVVVAPWRIGGLLAARRCAAVAEAADLPAMLACGDSAGVAVAAMLQLAAATPSLASANECGYPQLKEDVLTEPLEVIDGLLTVPQGAGLGVQVDRARLERFQVG